MATGLKALETQHQARTTLQVGDIENPLSLRDVEDVEAIRSLDCEPPDLERRLDEWRKGRRNTQTVSRRKRQAPPHVEVKGVASPKVISRPYLRALGKSEVGRANLRKAVAEVFEEREKQRRK